MNYVYILLNQVYLSPCTPHNYPLTLVDVYTRAKIPHRSSLVFEPLSVTVVSVYCPCIFACTWATRAHHMFVVQHSWAQDPRLGLLRIYPSLARPGSCKNTNEIRDGSALDQLRKKEVALEAALKQENDKFKLKKILSNYASKAGFYSGIIFLRIARNGLDNFIVTMK